MFSASQPENWYELDERDTVIVAAARTLLLKSLQSGLLGRADEATVSKLLFGICRLPFPPEPPAAKISVSGPRRHFGDVETFHCWDVGYEDGCWTLESAGHFHQPASGGDSFQTMRWSAAPGRTSTPKGGWAFFRRPR
jgi:hypothetical protein